MRSKQATRRAFSPPARCALVAWPPSRKASFAQQTLDIPCLVEILGGVESDRLDQPRRGEGRPIEIGAIKRDAGERRAAQGRAPQRGIGEIRFPERCEFEVDARQIRIAQDRPLEIASLRGAALGGATLARVTLDGADF